MHTLTEQASQLADLFPELYLRFHSRARKGERWLTPEMWGVLSHLAYAGPLTVTETARHVGRAQSVISEIVASLEKRELVSKVRDARDRRRTLVWLTPKARDAMRRERQVLDPSLIERALEPMPATQRAALIRAVRALIASADLSHKETQSP